MEKENLQNKFEQKVYWFVNGWRTVRIAPEIYLDQQLKLNKIVAYDDEGKRYLRFLDYLKKMNISPPSEPDLDLAVSDLITSFEFDESIKEFSREKTNKGQNEFVFGPLLNEESNVHPDWQKIDTYLLKWSDGKLFVDEKVNWTNKFKKQSLYRFLICIESYIIIPKHLQGYWFNKFASEHFLINNKPIKNLYDVQDYTPLKPLEPFRTELELLYNELNVALKKKSFDLIFS